MPNPTDTDSRGVTNNQLLKCVTYGEGYRVSLRHTMSAGEELIMYFEPVSSGGTIHIAPPAIESPQAADVDVYENPADPSANFANDAFVHNMRYDGQETPDAVVNRVTTGNLDTTAADQTEQSLVRANDQFATPGDSQSRGIWRTIPVGETVAMVITDQSSGSNNLYSFDTVVYEGEILPD